MKRRIRNLLALLLCFALVTAESSMAFAKKGEVVQDEPAVSENVEILGSSSAKVGDYTITGDLRYGDISTSYYFSSYYPNSHPWKVTDKDGNEVTDCNLRFTSLLFDGKEYQNESKFGHYVDGELVWETNYYADFYGAYRDGGLSVGDKVDLSVCLTLNSQSGYMTSETEPSIVVNWVIKDVEVVKGSVDYSLYPRYFYRGKNLNRQIKENRFELGWSGIGTIYMTLTEKGLKKTGDFSDDEYELVYGEDFSLSVKTWNSEDETIDISENYDFIPEDGVLRIVVNDSYSFGSDVREVQAGINKAKLQEILRKHAYLYKNDVKQNIDTSKIELVSINDLASVDDEAVNELLSQKGCSIRAIIRTEVGNVDGDPVYQIGYVYVKVRQNAYNVYIEPFEEVASATGASYERSMHDAMVNVYALKNETEKVRVGDFGNGERFSFRALNSDDDVVSMSENEAFFSKIRGGDEINYEVKWDFVVSDEDRDRDSWLNSDDDGNEDSQIKRIHYYGEDTLKFFAYDSSKDYTDPTSEYHKNDGQSIETLPEGAPAYVFDEEKSSTLVGAVKVNISKKFDSYVSLNGYDTSAKHRYVVSDKKIAKIDKNGNIVPKKSGTVKVTLEQKVKGSGWTQIGDPIELYIQVPEMQKSVEGTVGQTLDAKKFLSKTSFAPNSWKSSKPKVAEIDENGKITIKAKGKVKITAIYGEGKNSSKNKYKTKLKVTG